MFSLWIGLLPLTALLIVGLVILLRRRAWPVLAGLLVVVLILVGLTRLRARGVETAPRARPHSTTAMIQQMHQAHQLTDGSAWEELAEADLYPSLPAAARALAQRVARELGEDGPHVDVQSSGEMSALPLFAEALRQQWQGRRTVSHYDNRARGIPDIAGKVVIDLTPMIGNSQLGYEPLKAGQTARLEARWQVPGGTQAASVRWIEKPWVENLSEFLSRDSGLRHWDWHVARSAGLAASETEALEQAYVAAARHLAEQARNSLAARQALQQYGPQHAPAAEEWLLAEALAQVRTAPAQHDSFSQSFDRPYGRVYRAAVLMRTSYGHRDSLADAYAQLLREGRVASRVHILGTAGSVVGSGLLIAAVYWFLNMVTKGYYVRSLRWAAVVAAAGLAVLLLLIA